jgi:DNA-binding Xre family transcriptional regulator
VEYETGMEDLLIKARMSKAELARRLGVTANAVTRWKVQCPKYAIEYLKLFIEVEKLKP